MIEWKAALGGHFAFYANEEQTKVGYFNIDKTRRPVRWRLRLQVDGEATCSVIRIATPDDPRPLSYASSLGYPMARYVMGDLAIAAERFLLKPIGKQKSIPRDGIMQTDLSGIPHA